MPKIGSDSLNGAVMYMIGAVVTPEGRAFVEEPSLESACDLRKARSLQLRCY
jgi:hypothetical protein